jgi:TolB-like protein
MRESPGPPRLSIVVLPFANIGGNVDQEYFVDGVTESLTTDLSRMPGMLVIGRNTAFAYKGKSGDLKQIGRELNIRYVLEGSVQRGGNRMRVNVQLIDAETGNPFRYAGRDCRPARQFAQHTAHHGGSAARRTRASPDSMDHYFQGMALFNKGFAPDNLSRAKNYFERALSLDAGNVGALVGIAWANCVFAHIHTSDDRLARLAAGEAFATRALALAPEPPLGHMCLGLAYVFNYRATQGIAQCERALTLDRNLAVAHAYIGMAKWFVGRGEEKQGHIDEAFRLSPAIR